ncbi:hypothetical protein [Modestobacter sp. NPDC049651]|uniref:hypothetical protein n=1 Tax=unclassified Modestobacter TaxID=2643866 RepID=UPI003411936B
MTNAVTAGQLAGTLPTTPQQARSTWPRTAAVGVALVVLGVVAVAWHDSGARLLLGALGVLAAARGIGMLRAARAGELAPGAAPFGAAATWLGLVAVVVALVSGTATGWVLVGGAVLALPAVAASTSGRRAVAWAGAVAVLAAAVVVGVAAGTGALLTTAAVAVGLAAVGVGVADLVGAAGMRRLARSEAFADAYPAPGAGCGSCACGSGGCGGGLG